MATTRKSSGKRGPGRPRGVSDRFGPKQREQFLQAVAELGSYQAAAGRVGVSYQVALRYRKSHPEFDQQCMSAKLVTQAEVTSQLRRLALDGVVEPIFDRGGVQIGERRRYSERLLLAWLRRLESGSWLDRGKVEHTVAGKVEHEHTGRVQVEHLTPEQQRAARDFLRKLDTTAVERN